MRGPTASTTADVDERAYHATRSRTWPPGHGWVHLGTEAAARDKKSHDDALGATDAHHVDRYGPAATARWSLHEARLDGATYAHVLTDDQAHDLEDYLQYRVGDPRHLTEDDVAELGLPEHPGGSQIFCYRNHTEDPGSLSFLAHHGTVTVVHSQDLGPVSYARAHS